MMKFSIVTPSYNQAKYIEITIKSVLSQSYQNFEYIMMDGGSTDGTNEIIKKYSANFKKFCSEADDGQADAINKGFKYAEGDIFAYLNSDDYYFEDTLEKVAEIFERAPEVDVVYGNCVFAGTDGQFIRYFSEIENYNRKRLLSNGNYIMQPATFWRREVFEKYGPFDKDLHYGFDWAFWCELAKNHCNFCRIRDMIAVNREYDDTKTSSGSSFRLKELKYINDKYKTTLIPHAYFGYVKKELELKGGTSFFNSVKLNLFRILSYKNAIFHMRYFNNKIINGIFPRSFLLKKCVRIHLPYYENYSKINISLITPGFSGQSVAISKKNENLGKYKFEGDKLNVMLDMNGSTGDIDIRMKFDVEYEQSLTILEKFKYFYQPTIISAKLLKFQVI